MTRFRITLIATAVLAILFACNKDPDDTLLDTDGTAIGLPHLWRSSITDDGELSNTVIATAIIHDGNILVGSRKDGDRAILSLKASDGKVNWQWNDLLYLPSTPGLKDPLTVYAEGYHQNGGRMFFTYTGSSYCIELTTGTTFCKYKENLHRFDRNAGLNDTYFSSACNYEPVDEEKIYVGQVSSSEKSKLLLIPDYTPVDNPPVNARGYLTDITPFQANGNTYLAFGIENPYTDYTPSGWGLTELNLYNLTESKYEYSKVAINASKETRYIADLIYDKGSLYFQSANFIHRHDAFTGTEVWRVAIGSPPLLSNMILIENFLYSANEDRYLYCLDAKTGAVVWKVENTGTCTELSYLNGILYYLGGGDGLLHAVDANTGRHVWKVASPDLKKNSGAWFYGLCAAIPGVDGKRGVIVVTTGMNAYAYEAFR